MAFLGRIVVVCALTLSVISNTYAANRSNYFYRNFWLPTYHGERLNYCTVDSKHCGLPVASRYCQMMGYLRADQQVIDYNVGLTNFISSSMRCKGWRCNGFKTIRCVADLTPIPPKPYHYRFRRFVYPRFEQFRVAWCYDGQRNCGRRAAFSFCRRMGYLRASRYALQQNIAATKAIGNQKLCFGHQCNAFAYITCYR
ncbi:hypothetical protein [Legionella maceachernii]|uniref:Uncharacterized protein n=1 Tax=Legionella maceachernii TaxID=466 RepID=A0A0W0WAR8_9GAMM|nr:hypothetical protein [Legionella maceachernii]KTD29424.1 hypothetical protein Lmac_0934 [Legionella maceachernii]SJZ95153.1 hypothetical protein SAMN02745128_01566 [Legionella maceachernii]SUP03313.1 Uncharacterised protein [Legionella maceachernii]